MEHIEKNDIADYESGIKNMCRKSFSHMINGNPRSESQKTEEEKEQDRQAVREAVQMFEEGNGLGLRMLIPGVLGAVIKQKPHLGTAENIEKTRDEITRIFHMCAREELGPDPETQETNDSTVFHDDSSFDLEDDMTITTEALLSEMNERKPVRPRESRDPLMEAIRYNKSLITWHTAQKIIPILGAIKMADDDANALCKLHDPLVYEALTSHCMEIIGDALIKEITENESHSSEFDAIVMDSLPINELVDAISALQIKQAEDRIRNEQAAKKGKVTEEASSGSGFSIYGIWSMLGGKKKIESTASTAENALQLDPKAKEYMRAYWGPRASAYNIPQKIQSAKGNRDEFKKEFVDDVLTLITDLPSIKRRMS